MRAPVAALLIGLLATACRSSVVDTTDAAPAPSSTAVEGGAPPPCGTAGTACCLTTVPCDVQSQCIAGRCEACGQVEGQSCCVGDACSAPLECSAGVCTQCGRLGQGCCASSTPCFAGLLCNASGVCANL